MRILGEPDTEYEPRNELERLICTVLKTLTGQDIRSITTRDEYRTTVTDENENPIDPDFDYIVNTGAKMKDWYCSGWSFGVRVEDGRIIALEEIGLWHT